jgi:hypothetical protein
LNTLSSELSRLSYAFVTPAREGMLLFENFLTPDFFTGSYFIFLELVTFLPVADIQLSECYQITFSHTPPHFEDLSNRELYTQTPPYSQDCRIHSSNDLTFFPVIVLAYIKNKFPASDLVNISAGMSRVEQ